MTTQPKKPSQRRKTPDPQPAALATSEAPNGRTPMASQTKATNMADYGNFGDLASVKGNTVEKPKNLPDGHYSVIITGPFKEHKAKTGNFAMRYPLKIVEALSDVDAEALQDEGCQKALQRDYSVDFWMSPDARWRFTEFCKAMGIDDQQDLLSMGEELVASNTPFMMQGKNEADSNDPTKVFFRLDNPAPIADLPSA